MISAHNVVKAVLRADMQRSAYYRTRIDEDQEAMQSFISEISTNPLVIESVRKAALEVLATVSKAPAIAPFED